MDNLVSLMLMLITFLTPISLAADPWGKDADLVSRQQKCSTSKNTHYQSPITRWGIKAIRFHQEVISPADGPRSSFIPSSSQYTLDAMCKYGFFKGFTMGCDRLMRENEDPWVYRTTLNPAGKVMKFDPVP